MNHVIAVPPCFAECHPPAGFVVNWREVKRQVVVYGEYIRADARINESERDHHPDTHRGIGRLDRTLPGLFFRCIEMPPTHIPVSPGQRQSALPIGGLGKKELIDAILTHPKFVSRPGQVQPP